MPSCPFCQTELADDFGLIDCPGCEASLFIEMDGSVKANSDQEPGQSVEPNFESPMDQPLDESSSQEEFYQEEPLAESPMEDNAFEQGNFGLSEFEENPAEESPVAETPQEPQFESEPLEDFSSFEEPAISEDQAGSFPQDAPLEVPEPVADNFAATDLSELATAIDQHGSVDGLSYDVRIAGIDTADLRREVFESLTEKRLGWDIEDLKNKIDKGCLELKAISAVKAHIIIQRLKSMPLQIRWDQHADS